MQRRAPTRRRSAIVRARDGFGSRASARAPFEFGPASVAPSRLRASMAYGVLGGLKVQRVQELEVPAARRACARNGGGGGRGPPRRRAPLVAAAPPAADPPALVPAAVRRERSTSTGSGSRRREPVERARAAGARWVEFACARAGPCGTREAATPGAVAPRADVEVGERVRRRSRPRRRPRCPRRPSAELVGEDVMSERGHHEVVLATF